MPTPARTDLAAIVAAGRAILEADGADGLTMQAVATRVGVRAPSLYKHVRDRRALLVLVIGAALDDLAGRLEATATIADPRERLVRQADEVRRFAHDQPVGFTLVFTAHGAPRPDDAATLRSTQPLLGAVREIVGEAHALDAARLLTAWIVGFLGMELGGAFRLGGDVDGAWAWGLTRIVAALDAD
jgi:AcrR family transcriptional regulator